MTSIDARVNEMDQDRRALASTMPDDDQMAQESAYALGIALDEIGKLTGIHPTERDQ